MCPGRDHARAEPASTFTVDAGPGRCKPKSPRGNLLDAAIRPRRGEGRQGSYRFWGYGVIRARVQLERLCGVDVKGRPSSSSSTIRQRRREPRIEILQGQGDDLYGAWTYNTKRRRVRVRQRRSSCTRRSGGYGYRSCAIPTGKKFWLDAATRTVDGAGRKDGCPPTPRKGSVSSGGPRLRAGKKAAANKPGFKPVPMTGERSVRCAFRDRNI